MQERLQGVILRGNLGTPMYVYVESILLAGADFFRQDCSVLYNMPCQPVSFVQYGARTNIADVAKTFQTRTVLPTLST